MFWATNTHRIRDGFSTKEHVWLGCISARGRCGVTLSMRTRKDPPSHRGHWIEELDDVEWIRVSQSCVWLTDSMGKFDTRTGTCVLHLVAVLHPVFCVTSVGGGNKYKNQAGQKRVREMVEPRPRCHVSRSWGPFPPFCWIFPPGFLPPATGRQLQTEKQELLSDP